MNRFCCKESMFLRRVRRAVALFAAMAVLFAAPVSMVQAKALYILTGADDAAIVLDQGVEAPDISSRLVSLTTGEDGYDVTLTGDQRVTIRRGDTARVVQAREETVSALLERLEIDLNPLEMVAVDLSDPRGAVLTIAEQITCYDRVREVTPYGIVHRPNDAMPEGTEEVVQEGRDGERTLVYEVVWSSGERISTQLVEEQNLEAEDRIVEYGTAVEPEDVEIEESDKDLPIDQLVDVRKNEDGSGVLVFRSGATLRFRASKSMTATAYSKEEPTVGSITASGTPVHVGVVAVDRSVISLGTRMYITTSGYEDYGVAVAEDTGVRGNIVDLYYDTYRECVNFGRRSCTVYILE